MLQSFIEGRGIVRLIQSLIEGRGDHVKFIVTRPKSFDVSKLYYIDLASQHLSVQRRTESHKKYSNTTQQNGTELETN